VSDFTYVYSGHSSFETIPQKTHMNYLHTKNTNSVTYMSHFAPYPQKGQPRASSWENEEIRLNLWSKKQILEN